MSEVKTLIRRRKRIERFSSLDRLLFYGPPEDLSPFIKAGMIGVGDYVHWKDSWQRVAGISDRDFLTERGERVEFNRRFDKEFLRQRMSPLPIQVLSLVLAGGALLIAGISLAATFVGFWLQYFQRPPAP